MLTNELHNIVILEFFCLAAIIVIIISSFKRWKKILCASMFLATVAFFAAWSNIMAFGAFMTYGASSLLLWIQQDKKKNRLQQKTQKAQTIGWGILATGVIILILNNIHNIYLHLNLNQTMV